MANASDTVFASSTQPEIPQTDDDLTAAEFAAMHFTAMPVDWTAFDAENWKQRADYEVIHHRLLQQVMSKDDKELTASIKDQQTAEAMLALVERFADLGKRFRCASEAFESGMARLHLALERYVMQLDADTQPQTDGGA